jgi:hypothetical protein
MISILHHQKLASIEFCHSKIILKISKESVKLKKKFNCFVLKFIEENFNLELLKLTKMVDYIDLKKLNLKRRTKFWTINGGRQRGD